jgi:hypothetical protein
MLRIIAEEYQKKKKPISFVVPLNLIKLITLYLGLTFGI